MEDLLELDDQGNEVEAASQGERSTATPDSKRQPKFNLDDNEDFRKFKSQAQKREAQLANEARQAANLAKQLEGRLRNIEVQGLDDAGRLKYERDEAYRQLESINQQQQQQAATWEWDRNMREINEEFGIPIEDLNENAENLQHAWKLAKRWAADNPKGTRRVPGAVSKSQQDDDEEMDNPNIDDRVGLGGGKATKTGSRIQQEYDTARANNDYGAMNAASDKAHRAGIELAKPRRR